MSELALPKILKQCYFQPKRHSATLKWHIVAVLAQGEFWMFQISSKKVL